MPFYDITDKAALKKHLRREVYRNLHKKGTVYSIRKEGLVEGHANFVGLDRPTFSVGPKGNQRVRDEQRKNVHAVIRGYIFDNVWHDPQEIEYSEGSGEYKLDYHKNDRDEYEWKQVAYNPYKYQTFVTVEDEQPIFEAYRVLIGKTVWALVRTLAKTEEN
jgi:hypothetical protein